MISHRYRIGEGYIIQPKFSDNPCIKLVTLRGLNRIPTTGTLYDFCTFHIKNDIRV